MSLFGGKDKQIAAQLESLFERAEEGFRTLSRDRASQNSNMCAKEVMKIGEKLNADGGMDRMVRVCKLLPGHTGCQRWVEQCWSGIGEWRG